MPPVIQTRSLTKSYGRARGIIDVDLSVEAGEVFGLLGPNGAGKTTTIRILLDAIRPTGGEASVFGLDARRDSVAIRQKTGFLPGELALYDWMTARQLLEFFSRLRRNVSPAEIERIAAVVGLDLDRKISALSKGNRQKVGVLQAFMGRPELLILDEPTSGLDPLVQESVHNLIREAAREGRTVFLSSHVLSEVEELCGRVAIIREGRIVACENVTVLKQRAVRKLEIEFASAPPASSFEELPGVRDVLVDGTRLACVVTGSVDAVVKTAARFEVVNITSQRPSLEEVFLTYYS